MSGGAAAVEAAVDDVAAERVVRPVGGVALRDDVGVSLEQQGGAGESALDRGDHVGPAGRGLLDQGRPAEVAHALGDQRRGGGLGLPGLRTVDGGHAHERAGELDQALGVQARRRHRFGYTLTMATSWIPTSSAMSSGSEVATVTSS
jgi:hypothetical protein